MTNPSIRHVAAIAALITLTGLALPATAEGPLPSAEPAVTAAQTSVENAREAAQISEAYVSSTGGHVDVAINAILNGSPGRIVVPTDQIETAVEEGARLDEDGDPQGAFPEIIRLTGDTGVTVLESLGVEAEQTRVFADTMGTVALNKMGLEPGQAKGTGLPVALPSTSDGACTDDPAGAITAAEPGEEILVCPGSYEPFTVDEPFLTVRSAQGPMATIVETGGADGITVEAAGVTVEGFQVRGATDPGAAAIRVQDTDLSTADRAQGDLVSVTIRDNLLRGNTHGILVDGSAGTLVEQNTIRRSTGAALLVLEDPAKTTEAAGVVVTANSFLINQGMAIQNEATVPVVAGANYYGSATGPTVEVGGTCVGPGAPSGDPGCHNALSSGVVTVGFSPVPLAR